MPAVGIGEIVCGFEVFGDERGILIRVGDGVDKAAVQLRSGGLELRRVGNGLNQGMMKRVLRVGGVARLWSISCAPRWAFSSTAGSGGPRGQQADVES